MKSISTAPKDGTEIIGIYEDGTEELIYWNTDRYCMLGRRAGSFSDGWSPAHGDCESHLPLEDELIVAWKPA